MDDFLNHTAEQGHIDEIKRLKDNDEVFKAAMGGAFLIAPVDFSRPGLKVLDSAAADGEFCLRGKRRPLWPVQDGGCFQRSPADSPATWLRDLQSSNPPGHQYIGTDINEAIFPKTLPDGITMQKQSFTDPWPSDWNGTFDVVHQKLGLAGAGQTPLKTVISNMVGLLKPGGWMELAEMSTVPPEGTGPATHDFLTIMQTILASMPAGPNYALELDSRMSDAGLVNIEQRKVTMQSGVKAERQDLIAKSINGVCGAIPPLLAVAERMPRFPNPQ